ncbi:MAG: hypothetical protein ACYTEW_26285 [Planctomycetota bacterium]|jgi:hypothetical protein
MTILKFFAGANCGMAIVHLARYILAGQNTENLICAVACGLVGGWLVWQIWLK